MSRFNFIFRLLVMSLPLVFFFPFAFLPTGPVKVQIPNQQEELSELGVRESQGQTWESWGIYFGSRQPSPSRVARQDVPEQPPMIMHNSSQVLPFQPIGSVYQGGKLVLFLKNIGSGRVVELRLGEGYLGYRLVSESAVGYTFEKEGEVVQIPK